MRGKSIAVYRLWNALITCCLELGVVKSCSLCPTELASLPLLLAAAMDIRGVTAKPKCSCPFTWKILAQRFSFVSWHCDKGQLLFSQAFTWPDPTSWGKEKTGRCCWHLAFAMQPSRRKVLAEPRARAGEGWVGLDWSHSCHKVELGICEVPRASSWPQKHQPVVQLWPAHAHPLPSSHSTFLVFPRERENIWQLRFYLFWSSF